jgi:type II restriction enzyme
MNDDEREDALAKLAALASEQQRRVFDLIDALTRPRRIRTNPQSDFASPLFVGLFADVLVAHHAASGRRPFTKEKFEHEVVRVLRAAGHVADSVPGQTARDITVDGAGWSLKTQADAAIDESKIHVSKFMELGRGKWETVDDLRGLRDAMLRHMASYDRIFTLRCFANSPRGRESETIRYELVEIPKALLGRAAGGSFRMIDESQQRPKPGYCVVRDSAGRLLFQLYFDGGTERKLQIIDLLKSECVVHVVWELEVPA